MEGNKEYILKHGGSNENDFAEDEFLDDGDADNPGGCKTIIFCDEEGIEHHIKLPVKN